MSELFYVFFLFVWKRTIVAWNQLIKLIDPSIDDISIDDIPVDGFIQTGTNGIRINLTKNYISQILETENEVILYYDEMRTQQKLIYNEINDEIDGYVNIDGQKEPVVASMVGCYY